MTVRFCIDNETYLLHRKNGSVSVSVFAEGWIEIATDIEEFDHAFGTHRESVVDSERSVLDLEYLSVSVISENDELYYIQARDEMGYDDLLKWIKIQAIEKAVKGGFL
jgi:hypothetical protein